MCVCIVRVSNISIKHINQIYQSNISIKHINQTHQSNILIKHIINQHINQTNLLMLFYVLYCARCDVYVCALRAYQTYQSNISIKHLNQTHQSNTSIKHINQTHHQSTQYHQTMMLFSIFVKLVYESNKAVDRAVYWMMEIIEK